VTNHKSGGRLPLLSARLAVTPATLKRASTSFADWRTEANGVNSLPNRVATAGATFLDFQTFEILTVAALKRVNMSQQAKLQQHWTRLQRYGDLIGFFFQNGDRPPSWICWARIRTNVVVAQ